MEGSDVPVAKTGGVASKVVFPAFTPVLRPPGIKSPQIKKRPSLRTHASVSDIVSTIIANPNQNGETEPMRVRKTAGVRANAPLPVFSPYVSRRSVRSGSVGQVDMSWWPNPRVNPPDAGIKEDGATHRKSVPVRFMEEDSGSDSHSRPMDMRPALERCSSSPVRVVPKDAWSAAARGMMTPPTMSSYEMMRAGAQRIRSSSLGAKGEDALARTFSECDTTVKGGLASSEETEEDEERIILCNEEEPVNREPLAVLMNLAQALSPQNKSRLSWETKQVLKKMDTSEKLENAVIEEGELHAATSEVMCLAAGHIHAQERGLREVKHEKAELLRAESHRKSEILKLTAEISDLRMKTTDVSESDTTPSPPPSALRNETPGHGESAAKQEKPTQVAAEKCESEKARAEVAAEKQAVEKCKSEVAAEKQAVEKRKSEVDGEKQALQRQKNEVAAEKKALETLNGEISAEKRALEKRNREIAAEKQALEKLQSEIATEKEKLEKRNSEITAEKQTLEKRSSEAQVEKQRLGAESELLATGKQRLLADAASLETQKTQLVEDAAQLSKQKEALDEQKNLVASEQAELEQSQARLLAERSKVDKATADLLAEKQEVAKRMDELAEKQEVVDNSWSEFAAEKQAHDKSRAELTAEKLALDRSRAELAAEKNEFEQCNTKVTKRELARTQAQLEKMRRSHSQLDGRECELDTREKELQEKVEATRLREVALQEETEKVARRSVEVDAKEKKILQTMADGAYHGKKKATEGNMAECRWLNERVLSCESEEEASSIQRIETARTLEELREMVRERDAKVLELTKKEETLRRSLPDGAALEQVTSNLVSKEAALEKLQLEYDLLQRRFEAERGQEVVDLTGVTDSVSVSQGGSCLFGVFHKLFQFKTPTGGRLTV